MQSPIGKSNILAKPTLDTPFHIDYNWFERTDVDLRREILSQLGPEQRERLSQSEDQEQLLDYVDPNTGEVTQVDELGLEIQVAAQDPNFINPQTSVIDSVFRIFLANSNQPLTPNEIAERLSRPAKTILGAISGRQIYKGIRPASSS
ncbi:MAG: hypothetical protein IAE89_15965 [Anaerolineae bacterium]|nr:hypothetical protein [Anaerolineae bacterium]